MITAIAPFLLFSCLLAGTFALVAVVLVFRPPTRRASIRFAVAAIIFSINSCFLEVIGVKYKVLMVFSNNVAAQLAIILAPLVVGVAVCFFGRCALKKDRERTDAA
jgi:apolipoprotein N-acyltransferase